MGNLISTQNFVESPFIIVKIGKYTFGSCEKGSVGSRFNTTLKVTYPNFMKSIRIVKVNGAINTYTITMEYGISLFDDPNLLEKVFGSISDTRKITISYGDWNMPQYIYKEEEAIITNLKTSVDFKSSKITYTISCTSTAIQLKAGIKAWSAVTAKPSDIIKDLLTDRSTGLYDIFPGMRNFDKVLSKNFIVSDDKKVLIPATQPMSVFDYIGYLVSYMVDVSDDSSNVVKSCRYYWSVYDDISNEYGGAYFKVIKVDATTPNLPEYSTYEVDIGYPGGNFVSDFRLSNDQSWSILYNYSLEANMNRFVYTVDNNGDYKVSDSPNLTMSPKYLVTTEADRTWWSNVTLFPILATLTIKGLTRPTMLMQYLKIHSYFYGHKHISSGLYIITKLEDEISESGYKTTLSLTRIAADTYYNYPDVQLDTKKESRLNKLIKKTKIVY